MSFISEMGGKKLTEDQKQLHEAAVAKKEFWYVDPETGYKVLTAYFLCERGYCCKSFCRHCPYGFSFDEDEEMNE